MPGPTRANSAISKRPNTQLPAKKGSGLPSLVPGFQKRRPFNPIRLTVLVDYLFSTA